VKKGKALWWVARGLFAFGPIENREQVWYNGNQRLAKKENNACKEGRESNA
jgi:hypothetical protein